MEKINFIATDGVRLYGFLQKSINIKSNNEINKYKSQENNKIILSIHGMGSNCFKRRDEIIAKIANENDIDYFSFNNRGSEFVRKIEKETEKGIETNLGGTTFEDVEEGYYDILGALRKLKELGYTKIYIQGHSLGCTKIIYTYNKLLKNKENKNNKEKNEEEKEILDNITGIILLSLVDIPAVFKIYLGEKYTEYIKLAEIKNKEGKKYDIMPNDACICPISVKTFLRYLKENKNIDFANYTFGTDLPIINQIEKPLFMRWGNINEMILEDAKNLVIKMNKIIKNKNKNINYIDGANHSYEGKEEKLAKEIIEFVNKN